MERAGELEPAGPVVHDGCRADTHSTRRRVREMLRAGHPFQVLPQAPKHLGQRLTGDSRLPLFGQHGAVDGHQPQFGPTATEIDTGAIHQSLYSLTACGPDCKRRYIGIKTERLLTPEADSEIDTGAIHQSLYSLTACGPDSKRRYIGIKTERLLTPEADSEIDTGAIHQSLYSLTA